MTAAKPLARYSAVEGALASGLATADLHHAVGHDPAVNRSSLSRRDNVIDFPGLRRPLTTDLMREPIARCGRKSRIEVVGDKFGSGAQDDWVIIEVLTQRRHLADASAALWPIID